MPPSQVTPGLFVENTSPQLSAGDMGRDLADFVFRTLKDKSAVEYGQLDVGCDGLPRVKPLNGVLCCAGCSPLGSGPIVPMNRTTMHGVPVALSRETPRIFAGTGGQSAVFASATLPVRLVAPDLRDRIRFYDSQGNLWGPTGAYLGPYGGAGLPIAFSGYWYPVVGEGDQKIAGPGPTTSLIIGDHGPSAWGMFGFEYTTPNVVVRGNGPATGAGFKTDDVIFGLERPNTYIGGHAGFGIVQAVIRDPGTLALIAVSTTPFAVPSGTKTHVFATEDGSFWSMVAGSKNVRRFQWNGSVVSYVQTITIGSGGTAWSSTTRMNGFLL